MGKELRTNLGILILFLILGTGCSSTETPLPLSSPTSIEVMPPQVNPTSTETNEDQVLVTTTPDLVSDSNGIPLESISYHIKARLDYFNHQVAVEQTILIPHPAQDPIQEIVLVVPPNAWPQVFTIQSILIQDIPLEGGFTLEGVRITIPLEEYWMPGEYKELNIRYNLNLPIQNAREGFGPSPFGYSELQTNLVDWYPIVPPYQDGEWLVHTPWIFGEYLVYPAANFQISLEISGSQDMVVAASSEANLEGDARIYSLTQARNFVFSISPHYQIFQEEVNGTKVYGYYFPTYQRPGQAAFNTTKEALSLYSELFGPYNQSSLSMVQADFNHGMEYEGLYFQSRGFFDSYNGSEESYLVTIAAHETAHQWWYGQVANDQALEPWLDEALCTYSELIYYENLYPDSVDWWWMTRVNYYEPFGVINRSIYDFGDFTDQYLAYRNATYLQGAKFFDSLRKAMGDEEFLIFLRDYGYKNTNQVSSQEGFFSRLSLYIDLDSLDWLPLYFRE